MSLFHFQTFSKCSFTFLLKDTLTEQMASCRTEPVTFELCWATFQSGLSLISRQPATDSTAAKRQVLGGGKGFSNGKWLPGTESFRVSLLRAPKQTNGSDLILSQGNRTGCRNKLEGGYYFFRGRSTPFQHNFICFRLNSHIVATSTALRNHFSLKGQFVTKSIKEQTSVGGD